MSDFNYQPTYGAAVAHGPRVRVAQFGDGYEQRVADGINTDMQQWQLMFVKATATIAAIDAQLAGYGGVTRFTWTPSGRSEIKVVCREWSRSYTDKGVDTLSAKFDQVNEA